MKPDVPTIGRIVHYEHEGQTLPAIVTNVVGDNLVNLQVFKDSLGNCYFHEGVEMGEGEGYWKWPPKSNQPEVVLVTPVDSGTVTNPPVTNVPPGTGTGNVGGVPLVSTPFPSVTSKP